MRIASVFCSGMAGYNFFSVPLSGIDNITLKVSADDGRICSP